MAKAALNMMTRTCAGALAAGEDPNDPSGDAVGDAGGDAADAPRARIFMTSVDTGWINDENPLPTAARTAAVSNFQTPIDEVDAAARILDPVFDGVNRFVAEGKTPLFGVFLKDYHETEW